MVKIGIVESWKVIYNVVEASVVASVVAAVVAVVSVAALVEAVNCDFKAHQTGIGIGVLDLQFWD